MVSIVIPVYQVEEYIERCISSVMRQNYKDIECIIVDDGGSDNSISICEKLINTYKGPIKFTILHHQRNMGLSAARNTGTNAAKGEFLYYLDGDDEITTDYIYTLERVAREDKTIEMVQGNSIAIRGDREDEAYWDRETVHLTSNKEIRDWYFNRRTLKVSVWNKLLRRDFINNNKLYCREGILYEDLLWTFFLLKHVNHAILCKEVTHYYHIRPGSIVTATDPLTESYNLTVIYEEILKNPTIGHETEELRGYLYMFCKVYTKHKDFFKLFPKWKEVMALYKTKAKQFACWYDYTVLSLIDFACRINVPSNVWALLNQSRWKLRRLFYRFI